MARTGWQRRRERMEQDPAFRRRVYAQQSESRRRRKQREREGLEPECPFIGAHGRRCWLPLPHVHRSAVTRRNANT